MVPGSNPNVWKPQTWIVRSSRVQNPANHIEKISTAYLSRFSGFDPHPGRTSSKSWPLHFQKKISSCPKKCKTFFDPNGLWHLFAANYKLKCNKRQFFVDSCESYIFSTGEKKQETDEEEEDVVKLNITEYYVSLNQSKQFWNFRVLINEKKFSKSW